MLPLSLFLSAALSRGAVELVDDYQAKLAKIGIIADSDDEKPTPAAISTAIVEGEMTDAVIRELSAMENLEHLILKRPISDAEAVKLGAGLRCKRLDLNARLLGAEGLAGICLARGVETLRIDRLIPADRRRAYHERIPLGRFGRPDEIAAVVTALVGDAGRYMTGSVVDVNGGLR